MPLSNSNKLKLQQRMRIDPLIKEPFHQHNNLLLQLLERRIVLLPVRVDLEVRHDKQLKIG